jgi:homogentisate 1,2-dioxygenase
VEFFDELAVMVDTFRPLDLCEPALECEDTGYAWTWARRQLDTGSISEVDPSTG